MLFAHRTDTADILHWLLLGLQSRFKARRTHARYSANGAEATIEFNGIFYRITVEPWEGTK